VDLLRQRLARPTAIEREQKLEIHRLLTPMRLKRSTNRSMVLKDLAFPVSHQKLPVRRFQFPVLGKPIPCSDE
jgi:hypothetical protein